MSDPRTRNAALNEMPVSLIRGGTAYWIQEKARLISPDQWNLGRRLFIAITVAWVPLAVLAGARGGNDFWSVISDYRVNARVFIAIPLLIIAQIGMEQHFRDMARYFLEANLVRQQDLGHFQGIMKKAVRLRDAKWPELLVIVGVFLQLAYMFESGRMKNASWATDLTTNTLTPAGYWSTFVTQAVFMALIGLVLWKWLIWILVMRDLAKMELRLDPTDGDRIAGLGFLSEIPKAFIPVLLAISAVIGSTWRFQTLSGEIELKTLEMPAALLTVLAMIVFVFPLVVFTPKLLKSKREGAMEYAALRHLYSLDFRKKWVDERPMHLTELLGTRDVGSLSSISSSFKNVEEMKIFPFRKSTLVAVVVALAVPMIPVATTQIPLMEVLKSLFNALH